MSSKKKKSTKNNQGERKKKRVLSADELDAYFLRNGSQMCGPKCVYFPRCHGEVLNEYTDENDLKHRECVYTCGYDLHRIEEYVLCSNFLNRR